MWKTIALSLLNRALALLLGELWQWLKDTVKVYESSTLTGNQKREAVVLMELLFGMLGLAGLRSWEKGKGVAR